MRLAELDLEEKALLQDVLTLDRTDSWGGGSFLGEKDGEVDGIKIQVV